MLGTGVVKSCGPCCRINLCFFTRSMLTEVEYAEAFDYVRSIVDITCEYLCVNPAKDARDVIMKLPFAGIITERDYNNDLRFCVDHCKINLKKRHPSSLSSIELNEANSYFDVVATVAIDHVNSILDPSDRVQKIKQVFIQKYHPNLD